MAAHTYACTLFEYNVFANPLSISLSVSLTHSQKGRVSDGGTQENKMVFIFVEPLLYTNWYYARYFKYTMENLILTIV